MFEIEQSIPMPRARARARGGNGARLKYPFRKMLVGDSFFVPADNPLKALIAICGSYYPIAKDLGWKFSARIVDGGVRCWRVE